MPAGQSAKASAIEALAGTAAGFLLSILAQRLLFPQLGHDLSLAENALVSTVFTALSLGRGYAVRRLFNALAGWLP